MAIVISKADPLKRPVFAGPASRLCMSNPRLCGGRCRAYCGPEDMCPTLPEPLPARGLSEGLEEGSARGSTFYRASLGTALLATSTTKRMLRCRAPTNGSLTDAVDRRAGVPNPADCRAEGDMPVLHVLPGSDTDMATLRMCAGTRTQLDRRNRSPR